MTVIPQGAIFSNKSIVVADGDCARDTYSTFSHYSSKCSPIEHQVFPHITRLLKKVVLTTPLLIKELMEKQLQVYG